MTSNLPNKVRSQPAATGPRAKKAAMPPFDKYYYYSASVQSPEEDVLFLDSVYKEVRQTSAAPKILREDFCGTFVNCCEWVKLGPGRVAHGVDLDPEPLAYGREHYLTRLSPDERERLKIHQRDVLGPKLPKADVICALNFSYFIFKERENLKRYLANCRRGLAEGGVLVLDCFGGTKCTEANEEYSEHGDPPFLYYWDQDSYDPLTNEGVFYIHFKRRGEAKRERVFTYDWRLWSPPELKDILLEVGYKDVHFYWEGSTPDGDGDGDFKIVQRGEECESWVAYIAAAR